MSKDEPIFFSSTQQDSQRETTTCDGKGEDIFFSRTFLQCVSNRILGDKGIYFHVTCLRYYQITTPYQSLHTDSCRI